MWRQEIAVMAADVSLTPDEFMAVAHRPGRRIVLLARRVAALQLSSEEIRDLSPMLLGDLRRTCARCAEKRRCTDDLKVDPDPAGWQKHCANASTLQFLA